MPLLYRSFLTIPQQLLLENNLSLPDELILQSHWFNGHFGSEFTTDDGQKVIIKQLGFWNRSAGPDFLNCAIEIDGKPYSGSIELDHSSEHWQLHGHATNSNFDDVILHVIFEPDYKRSFTRTKSNKHVPKVLIDEPTIKTGLSLTPLVQATSHIGRCSIPLNESTPERVFAFLKSVASHRIAQKNLRAQQTIRSHGKAQTLWIQIAETLGYKSNNMAFVMLAQRLNIQKLSKKDPLEIQAIIFGAAGFLHPNIHTNAPLDSQKWLENLWQTWWQLRQQYEVVTNRSIKWSLAGIRPTNHPQRRLAALTQIAINWRSISSTKALTDLKELLLNLTDPYWNNHYTLTSKRAKNHLRLIGEDRVNDLLVNHLLPMSISNNELCSWETYSKIKAPAISEKVNRAATRLFGNNPNKGLYLKNSWQHQALLQIYHDFCLQDTSNCSDCPFPEQLKTWAQETNITE